MSKLLAALILLLIMIALASLPAKMVAPPTDSEDSMIFLGRYKEIVVGDGVLAYVHAGDRESTGAWVEYEIVVDYHGRVVRGVALDMDMCHAQLVAVSSDGEYVAFINMSAKPGIAYVLNYTSPNTGSLKVKSVLGVKWDLVLVSGEGEEVLVSGIMPVTLDPGPPTRLVAEWGCPMVAFKGRMLYLLSVEIFSNAPASGFYTVDPDTGETKWVVGVLDPPPAYFFAPLTNDSALISFMGYDFGGIVVRPDGAYPLTNLTQYHYGRWYAVEGGVVIPTILGTYLVRPDLTVTRFPEISDVSPDGRWVAVGGSLYEVSDGVPNLIFSGFDPDDVRVSNSLIAYRKDDTITVATHPPSMEVLAKVDLRGKLFEGPDGVTYLLRPEDFFISDTELVILYSYYDTDGETNYVLERIPLEPKEPLRVRDGELTEIRECEISLETLPRTAALSGDVLAVSTDEGIVAFRGCEKLWEISYPLARILGVRDGVLYVHNGTTYYRVDLSSGEVIEGFVLPTRMGGYDVSYYWGELLEDGSVVIDAVMPGQVFYLLIKGAEYRAIDPGVPGFTAVSWDEVYDITGQYLMTPNSAVILPERPVSLYVLNRGLALASFSGHATMVLTLDRNTSVYITSGTLWWFSPAEVGGYPAILMTASRGEYEAVLVTYAGDDAVIYRAVSQEPIAAAYGDGVLAVVSYGDGASTVRFYEVMPP